jgi:hypothetical protein
MGRPRLRAITACAVLALAGSARAAELTRLASAMESDNPFDLYLSVRWDRLQERARITQEHVDLTSGPFGSVQELTALRYQRVTNALVPRVAIGVYQDLELHVEMPYVLADDSSWRYGFRNGLPVSDPMPFPVDAGQTVFHGGAAGDLRGGLAWGIFNDRKDDTKPFWLVGLDITFPLANLYDPGQNRVDLSSGTASPYTQSGKPGPFGEKVWKYDFYTALSRRLGPIDPYVKGHLTAVMPSNQTYSNCDHVAAGSPAATWSQLE